MSTTSEEPPEGAQGSTQKYDALMRRRVTRVKKQATGLRLFLYWSTILITVFIVVVVAIDNLVTPMKLPIVIALGFITVWVALYSKFILPFRIALTCPSCDEQINLNQSWICGWCDHAKSSVFMQTFVSYRVALEPCNQCHDHANAVECPHCKEHIVINVQSYKNEQEYGALHPGVARMKG